VISVETIGKMRLIVYPTVTTSILNNKTTEIIDYQIYTLLGREVLNGKTRQVIDVSSLHKGTYLLKVGVEIVKFIKQ
jgi:hypothetical protein